MSRDKSRDGYSKISISEERHSEIFGKEKKVTKERFDRTKPPVEIKGTKYEPYISCDIETTGLDEKNGLILEIGVVFEDFKTPVDELVRRSILIKNDGPLVGNFYAMFDMNQDLIHEIYNPGEMDEISHSLEEAHKWFIQNQDDFREQMGLEENCRITYAGKNFGVFDRTWLKEHGFCLKRTKHRILDVGPMYFEEFGYVPNLKEIKELIGDTSEVAHRATDDALDVIKAIRYKLGIEI